MNELKDVMAKMIYGMSVTEAHNQGICVCCKEKIKDGANIYTPLGKKEYGISGLCEICFDKTAR